jgi:hypothetical protein
MRGFWKKIVRFNEVGRYRLAWIDLRLQNPNNVGTLSFNVNQGQWDLPPPPPPTQTPVPVPTQTPAPSQTPYPAPNGGGLSVFIRNPNNTGGETTNFLINQFMQIKISATDRIFACATNSGNKDCDAFPGSYIEIQNNVIGFSCGGNIDTGPYNNDCVRSRPVHNDLPAGSFDIVFVNSSDGRTVKNRIIKRITVGGVF